MAYIQSVILVDSFFPIRKSGLCHGRRSLLHENDCLEN
jgi:hypothetical protein